jgi:RimJ/RimL family protein N-acetyltransferase
MQADLILLHFRGGREKMDFKAIDINDVRKIQAWRYPNRARGLHLEPYIESYNRHDKVLRGPRACEGFAVYHNDALFGMFEYAFGPNGLMEVNAALDPRYLGKGYGAPFIRKGLAFGISHYRYLKEKIRLTVDIENAIAIKACRKAGFRPAGFHLNDDGEIIMAMEYLLAIPRVGESANSSQTSQRKPI